VSLGRAKGDDQFGLYRREDDPVLRERDEEFRRQQAAGRKARPTSSVPPVSHGDSNGAAHGPAIDWEAKARQFAAQLAPALREELAAALGLPVACLDAIPLLGWNPDNRDRDEDGNEILDPCWTFPEVDGDGRFVGITRRDRNGRKRAMPGSARGLTVPERWREYDGPIYLVEGPSDVLALTAMGLCTIGRPSNTGGVQHLAKLLADVPSDRRLIVLGENDCKPHGEWPGRDGALRTAQKLTHELGRPVLWAMAPDKAKDARQWVLARNPDLTISDAWHDLGDKFRAAVEGAPAPATSEPQDAGEWTLGELLDRHQALRPPVVHGLLRQGESMNVIALSKVGKSWLVVELALAAAMGGTWLAAFQVEQGQVLIIDNELHSETLADRIRKVAEARGIELAPLRDLITIKTLRGRLRDILSLRTYLEQFEAGRFKLVILDTLYRMLPPDVSENDNAAMAGVYNAIDSYADRLGCCFVTIHHTSKGSQADKAVTDVGAGAGSQSRAVDTHLVLRPHEEDGVFVLEAAVRSWAPVKPRCLRWDFPVWQPVEGYSPELLKRPEDRRRQAAKEVRAKRDDGELLAKLDALDPGQAGYGVRQLRLKLSWGHDRTVAAVERLVDAEILEHCTVPYTSGKGAEDVCAGVKRRCQE
jgi:hypothetical protein